MVQLYSPNVVGKQILIDVKNIDSDKFKTVEYIESFMDKVVEESKLNVINKCSHQLKKDDLPYGVTIIIYYQKVIYLFIHVLMKVK
jgi:S-adenosylmethionine/arginine decarboxylase-like enzyme